MKQRRFLNDSEVSAEPTEIEMVQARQLRTV